jgi:hypothetical protein
MHLQRNMLARYTWQSQLEMERRRSRCVARRRIEFRAVDQHAASAASSMQPVETNCGKINVACYATLVLPVLYEMADACSMDLLP